jgi:hypothetical protein
MVVVKREQFKFYEFVHELYAFAKEVINEDYILSWLEPDNDCSFY